MAGNGWTLLEWLEMDGNEWLEIPGNGWQWLEIAGMAGNCLNGWKLLEWLEMSGNGWKGLEMA